MYVHCLAAIFVFFSFDNFGICQTSVFIKPFELNLEKTEVIGGASLVAKIDNVCLSRCAVLCLKEFSCNIIQFSVFTGTSKGTCLMLQDANNATETFACSEVENKLCYVYKIIQNVEENIDSAAVVNNKFLSTTDAVLITIELSTTLQPSTIPVTTTELSTTLLPTTIPPDRDPTIICDYAILPAKVSCSCNVKEYCTGILRCNGTVSGTSVEYYLDRTSNLNQSDAEAACKNQGMDLINVRDIETQSTLCSILAAAVGNVPMEAYWLAIKRNMAWSIVYIYSDGQMLSEYKAWDESQEGIDPNWICTLLQGGSGKFQWTVGDCASTNMTSGHKTYVLCEKSGT